jgi:cell division protein YceG involved in septum cleavage
MTIEYENYKLDLKDGRYDVYKKITRNKVVDKKPTGETYEDLTTIGYGFRLESALRRIIEDRMESNLEIVTLSEAIKAYQKEVDLIYRIIKIKIPK